MSSRYKSSIPHSVPLNYVHHVNNDNMGFVLTLRSEVPNGGKIKQPSKAQEAIHQQPMVSKSNSCTNPLCAGDFDAIQHEIIERQFLLRQLALLQVDLEDEEVTRMTVEQEYHKIAQTQESLQQRLSALDVDYFKQRDKLTSALEEQKKLGEQISLANAIIRNEKEKVANMKKKKMAETNKKHNGVYTMQQTGLPMWSCCLSHDPNGGCIDEHSVGIRSHLIHAPRPPRPTSILPPSGHVLSSSLHNKSVYSQPKYAFWSTRKESSGIDGIGGSRLPSTSYFPSYNPSMSLAMTTTFNTSNHRPHTASIVGSRSRHTESGTREGGNGSRGGGSIISADTPSQTLPNLSTSSPGRRGGGGSGSGLHQQVSFYKGGDTEAAIGQSRQGPSHAMMMSGGGGGLGNSFMGSSLNKGEKNVGTVRVDYQGVLKKVNRPMSSPGAYSVFGQTL